MGRRSRLACLLLYPHPHTLTHIFSFFWMHSEIRSLKLTDRHGNCARVVATAQRETVITGRCEVAGCVQSIDAVDASTRRANRKKSDMWPVALSRRSQGSQRDRRRLLKFSGSISKQHPGCTHLPSQRHSELGCQHAPRVAFLPPSNLRHSLREAASKYGRVDLISLWYEAASDAHDSRHQGISEYTEKHHNLGWNEQILGTYCPTRCSLTWWGTTNISNTGVWSMNPTWNVLKTETTSTKVTWQVSETWTFFVALQSPLEMATASFDLNSPMSRFHVIISLPHEHSQHKYNAKVKRTSCINMSFASMHAYMMIFSTNALNHLPADQFNKTIIYIHVLFWFKCSEPQIVLQWKLRKKKNGTALRLNCLWWGGKRV